MTLRVRMSLMLGLLLLICAGGTATMQLLLRNAGESVARGQSSTQRLSKVQQLEIDLTSARNQINIWLQRVDGPTATRADGFLEQLARGATALRNDAALNAEQRRHLAAFVEARDGYLESWRRMQGIGTDRQRSDQLQEEAGARLDAAFGALTPAQAAALAGPIWNARRAANSLNNNPTTELRQQADAASNTALQAMLAAGILADAPLPRSLQEWARAVGASAQSRKAFADVLTVFRAQGNAMSAAIAELRRIEQATAQQVAAAVTSGLALSAQTGMIAAVLVVLAGLVCIWLLVRLIVTPLRGVTAAMNSIASGTLDAPIPGLQRRDELGQMAGALAVFRDGLAENQGLRERQEQQRVAAEAERQAAMQRMAENVEREAGAAVAVVRQDAQAMADTVSELTRSVQAATAQGEAAGTVARHTLDGAQAIASATEELSASVREISSRLAEANASTRRAAERGDASREAIAGLSEGVGRVGEVVRMISDIASRTNLLALNATIESARAGEAGKGFAVVASEVKQLAAQTARATEEVASKIQDITAATRSAVDTVQDMVGSINEIDEMATSIAGALEQQSAATREIAARVADATQGVRQLEEGVAVLNASSRATGTTAQQMQARAATTRDSVEELGGKLVHIVRAATG